MNIDRKSEVVPILVADDEPSDIFLLRRAFQKAGLSCPLFEVPDGSEAIKYLSGDDGYHDRTRYPLPGLLLLDIKMPKLDGFDVLQWLASRDELAQLPAVVLSSSKLQVDVDKALALGAKDYFVKPLEFNELQDLVRTIATRWLAAVPDHSPA